MAALVGESQRHKERGCLAWPASHFPQVLLASCLGDQAIWGARGPQSTQPLQLHTWDGCPPKKVSPEILRINREALHGLSVGREPLGGCRLSFGPHSSNMLQPHVVQITAGIRKQTPGKLN